MTFHLAIWYPSLRSRLVPLFPNANSWSTNCPSPISAGVPTEFGIVISRQWYFSIWWSGCLDARERFSITQNGSIIKWTLRKDEEVSNTCEETREGGRLIGVSHVFMISSRPLKTLASRPPFSRVLTPWPPHSQTGYSYVKAMWVTKRS